MSLTVISYSNNCNRCFTALLCEEPLQFEGSRYYLFLLLFGKILDLARSVGAVCNSTTPIEQEMTKVISKNVKNFFKSLSIMKYNTCQKNTTHVKI